jgi:hypothetical protein
MPSSEEFSLSKRNGNVMNSRQLKEVIAQMEALKTPESSGDFQAGVDAAKAVVNTIVQEALDRERIQKLEQELAELRAKYPSTDAAAPKRRGRKPKQATPENTEFETVAGA